MKFPAALAVLALTLPLAAAPPKPKTLEIGSKAPDFTLPGVDGRDWTLADFAEIHESFHNVIQLKAIGLLKADHIGLGIIDYLAYKRFS